jgi:hypothetical protein
MTRIFLFAGLLFFVLSCYNSKNANDRSGFEIYFGKSGGFTNIPMEYVLNEDGKVLKIQNDTTIEIQTITRKQMKEIKNLLDEIEFQDIDIDEPGNITYYIRTDSKKYQNTVRWTDTSDNQKVKDLYRKLLTTLK